MTHVNYRRQDADLVYAWMNTHGRIGTAFEIASDLCISGLRVRRAMQFIRQDPQYTDAITLTGESRERYQRTDRMNLAYLEGLQNQARHLETRCRTAVTEAQRAARLQSRSPELMQLIFGMATQHLTQADISISAYQEALSGIEKIDSMNREG